MGISEVRHAAEHLESLLWDQGILDRNVKKATAELEYLHTEQLSLARQIEAAHQALEEAKSDPGDAIDAAQARVELLTNEE